MIKLIALDVDGTLTRGEIIYTSNGESIKFFNVKDGLGISNAIKKGYVVTLITGRKCGTTEKRGSELGIIDIYQGISNKIEILAELCKKHNITPDNIAYMGDDLNDLGIMSKIGYSGAPKDAVSEVINVAHFISTKNGGEGAVREFIEDIMKRDGKWLSVVENYKLHGGKN